MLKSVFFITTLFLFLFLDNLFATNYYVSTTGNNGNAGTFGSPFATIAHAYSLANPGDSVIVMPGTYKEMESGTEVCFWFNRNGTAYQPIVVKSYTKGSAILDGQTNTTYKYAVQISGNYNVLDGFRVTNGSFTGITVQGTFAKVINCEIDNNGHTAGTLMGQCGIYEGNGGYHGTYIYNYIHNNGRTPGVGDHGVYIESDSVLVAYNVITYNSNAGVNNKGNYTRIYNNTLAHNGHGTGQSDEGSLLPNHTVIRNNIFYHNDIAGTNGSGDGYAIHDASDYITNGGRTPMIIKDNVFEENNRTAWFDMSRSDYYGSNWITQYHMWDTLNCYEYTGSLFVSDGSNYNLLNGSSPAIDNAFDWGQTQDYSGNTKAGSQWDIGSFQYNTGVGGGGGTLPTTTLNLKALIEALYVAGGNVMPVSQWVTVELHSSTAPYALVDSNSATLNTTGTGIFTFTKAVSGTNYFIVVKSMNTIATWSASPHSFTASALSYDFTTSVTQAYTDGSNPPLVLHNGKYCIYSGDLNQDGLINKTDYTGVDNDNSTFNYHPVNDLNGDGLVSSADAQFIDNNYIISIHRQAPAGAL